MGLLTCVEKIPNKIKAVNVINLQYLMTGKVPYGTERRLFDVAFFHNFSNEMGSVETETSVLHFLCF